ncbi:MAG: PEGA domain-containing protein [Candidatus Eisenbacteria bacterium]|nr:PEGA domain-containing protein [Candidatus Latescibacterota bacterium]MBD3301663.1 PEGA domain-containing protein [Candidatus Eisenbacteria bacterium]
MDATREGRRKRHGGRQRSGWKRLGAVLALAGVSVATGLVPPVHAQEGIDPPMTAGTLRLRSDPPGALVILEGEHRWTGIAPWDLNRNLRGSYKVIAQLDGYEHWERTIHLVEGESRELQIRLSPKSAWEAGLRSLLVPGWGQQYAGSSGKGALFFFSAAALGGGLWWADAAYQDRVDDYRDARGAYLSAFDSGSVEDVEALRGEMQRAEGKADDAYDRRQVVLYAVGGIYLISLVDALFFFPEPSRGRFVLSRFGENGPSLALEPSPVGEIRLSLSLGGRGGNSR